MTDKGEKPPAEPTDLERTQELFDFLQGKVPEGYRIPADHIPTLTADQAWTAVWYLQNLYWQVMDHIERCNVCEELYDTEAEGDCLAYGESPYHFCEGCMAGTEYALKSQAKENEA